MAGNLKFPRLAESGDKIVGMKSLKFKMLLQLQSGKLMLMDTASIEQMLISPHVAEIYTSLASYTSSKGIKTPMEFKVIRKSQGEMTDQKGSMFLIGITTAVEVNGTEMTAIETLDYTPTMPVAHIAEHTRTVVEKQSQETDPLSLVKQLVSRDKLDKVSTNPGEEDQDVFGTGKYQWLNTLLGIICFLLIAYLVKVMKPKSQGSTPSKFSKSGKGLFGKSKSPFGGSGGRKMGSKKQW